MKFKQGLLLEGTRVSFHLSHQCLVNSDSSSAVMGLLSPDSSGLCDWLHCRVWGGEGERRGRGGGEDGESRGRGEQQ